MSNPSTEDKKTTWDEDYASSLGVQAYIWGFPWIYLSQIAWLWSSKDSKPGPDDSHPWAPMNSFHLGTNLPTPATATGGSPNCDTLYSVAWLDLSREPLVLSVPAAGDRLYTLQLASIDSDNFAYVSTLATGNSANNYLIAFADWHGLAPEGVLDVLGRSPTPVAVVMGRTGVNVAVSEAHPSGVDLDGARELQKGYKLTPLSRFVDPSLPCEKPPQSEKPYGTDINDVSGAWATLNQAMTRNPPRVPPGVNQDGLIALFGGIGIGPKQTLDSQSATIRRGLTTGAENGLAILKQAVNNLGKSVNNWHYPPLTVGRAGTAGDYLTRAVMQALGGIVAHDPAEAVYITNQQDANGDPLTTDRKYQISFNSGDLPPFSQSAHGFWSLTIYDAETYSLPTGSAHYTVNSYDSQYARNKSGGMSILIQNDDPGDLPIGTHWLQPSAQSVYLILRIYAPTQGVSVTQTWEPPAVQRL